MSVGSTFTVNTDMSNRAPVSPAAQLSEYADGHRFCSLAKLDAILSHAEALLAALLADASVAALPALPPLLAGAAPYSTPETAAAAAPPPLSGMTSARTAAAHPTAAAAALLAPYRSDGRETSNSDDATGPAHARPAHHVPQKTRLFIRNPVFFFPPAENTRF